MNPVIAKAISALGNLVSGVLAGVLALVLLVWFGGRFIGLESAASRITAIAVVLGIYMVWVLARHLYLKKRDSALAKDLASSSIADDQLREKLDGVLDSIKTSNLGRRFGRNSSLYALPWYMIIGPSASGKSTLYSRSGLNFPFNDDEKYHLEAAGGTKNCDWWFSDEAILIDTAGRYTTQEESKEWIHFLQLLKKNRPKVPVNGVVLTLPMDELLTGDAESLKAHAQNMRNRLQEVIDELGVMAPVYIVITKSDLLRGFDAFFSDLSDAEAAQPWGVYMLEDTEDRKVDLVELFSDKVDALNIRLLEQRTQKMMLAQSAEQRTDIYQYPSQFSGASERLVEFVSLLFKESSYHEKPWFAGAYFTSSVQEGEVIERKSSLLKNIYANVTGDVFRSSKTNRSYFISQFFTQVIFPLKNAVRGNRKRQRFHLAVKTFSLAAMTVVVIAMGAGLTGTYTANKSLLNNYVDKAETLVERFQRPESTEVDKLEALLGLYRHFQDLEQISTYSPLMLLSRYDLIGTHGEPMRRLLVSSIEQMMVGEIAPQFTFNFRQLALDWEEFSAEEKSNRRSEYYDALANYLILTTHPEHYQRDSSAQYIGQVWYEIFTAQQDLLDGEQSPITAADLTQLASMYFEYSFETLEGDETNPWLVAGNVVERSQQHLQTPPDAQVLYDRLIAAAEDVYDAITLPGLVGSESVSVFTNPTRFSGIYTVDAWHDYVNAQISQLARAATNGDWVLGISSRFENDAALTNASADLIKDIRLLYFTDYIANWESLFRQSTAVQSSDLKVGIQAVKQIADPEGLLPNLFRIIDENMQLSEVRVALQLPLDDAEGDYDLASPIIPEFAELALPMQQLFIDSDDSGQADLLEMYLAEIQPLAEELDGIRVASQVDLEARRYTAGVMSGNSGNKKLYSAWINVDNLINTQAEASRAIVSDLMTTPLRSVWSSMVIASERSLQSLWQDSVYQTYRDSLSGKFPFSENGSDAALNDVESFLNPSSGQLWSFIENNLEPFVENRSGSWRVKTWLGEGLSFTRDAFAGFNSAQRVSNSLFSQGQLIDMRYWISPLPSRGVAESYLEVDADSYRYRNEPEQLREFNWSITNSQFAQIQVYLINGASAEPVSFVGPWSFVKLLSIAEIEHLGGTQFRLKWPLALGGGEVIYANYTARADRVGSIFNGSVFSGFSLPRRMFSR